MTYATRTYVQHTKWEPPTVYPACLGGPDGMAGKWWPLQQALAKYSPQMREQMWMRAHDLADGFGLEVTPGMLPGLANAIRCNVRAPSPRARAAYAKYENDRDIGSVVYYLRLADRCKIGTSTNLKARLAGIPHDEVLVTEPGDRALEQSRHRQFRSLRLTMKQGTEWFTYSGPLIDHVASLKAHGPQAAVSELPDVLRGVA